MNEYYFTYGTGEGYPYYGGWTVVAAPDRNTACALFRVFHPDRIAGAINCAHVYTAERFRETKMWEKGNFGKRCHERIEVHIERAAEKVKELWDIAEAIGIDKENKV